MSSRLYHNTQEFVLSSVQNFPFTMFITLLIFGALFGQATWMLVSVGMFASYLGTSVVQELMRLAIFNNFPNSGIIDFLQAGSDDSGICSPYSISQRAGSFPSHWVTQVAFLCSFIFYNSFILLQKKGNPSLRKAYERRLSKTQLSILSAMVVLFGLIILRVYGGCEPVLGAVLATGLGTGFGIAYWHLLDICNTQLNSDILGITRNMAPSDKNGEEVAVVCELPN